MKAAVKIDLHKNRKRWFVNTDTTASLTQRYRIGQRVAEGKTKTIYGVLDDPNLAILVSKDDITAGNGKKYDILPGKARLANRTTCNVFRLLKECEIPLAFIEQDSIGSFVARKCNMLPYEVVVRREAHGSYLKRHPHLTKGQLLPRLEVEFFLKTSGGIWKKHTLPCDDPLMSHDRQAAEIKLYDPTSPHYNDPKPFLSLYEMEVFQDIDEWMHFAKMESIARKVFLILEKAWQIESRTLVDIKLEFGLAGDKLLLADVIDNDSWRVLENGENIDKQTYRDGDTVENVVANYTKVAYTTDNFRLPRQQIILWRGSENNDLQKFEAALGQFKSMLTVVTCSTHKEPLRAIATLHKAAHAIPDSVVIAYIGKSNGAGPTLSAASTIPVITVPATASEHAEDVWSSLRTPSTTPVMTVLDPGNAALAALHILSARNPHIYAHVREIIEQRMKNTIYMNII